MNLTEAIQKRDELRGQGVKCQLRHEADDVWQVLLQGLDY